MSRGGPTVGQDPPLNDAPFGNCTRCGSRLSVMGAADDPAPDRPFRKRVALRCMVCGKETLQHLDPPA